MNSTPRTSFGFATTLHLPIPALLVLLLLACALSGWKGDPLTLS